MSAEYNLFLTITHVYNRIISFLISNDLLSLINLVMNYFYITFWHWSKETFLFLIRRESLDNSASPLKGSRECSLGFMAQPQPPFSETLVGSAPGLTQDFSLSLLPEKFLLVPHCRFRLWSGLLLYQKRGFFLQFSQNFFQVLFTEHHWLFCFFQDPWLFS